MSDAKALKQFLVSSKYQQATSDNPELFFQLNFEPFLHKVNKPDNN